MDILMTKCRNWKKMQIKMHVRDLPRQNTLTLTVYIYNSLQAGICQDLFVFLHEAHWWWCIKRPGEDDVYLSFQKSCCKSIHTDFSVDDICWNFLDLKSLQQPSILSRLMLQYLYLKMLWGYDLCLSQLTLQGKGSWGVAQCIAQAVAPWYH